MKFSVGVPKEIKNGEGRVALVPSGAAELISNGCKVFIESGAGIESNYSDFVYKEVGADIVDTKTAWSADLVVKVKEPLPDEYRYFTNNILLCFLHFAGSPPKLKKALKRAGTRAIELESLEDEYPALKSMARIAGFLATIEARNLCKVNTPTVVIVGDGNVGYAAMEEFLRSHFIVIMMGINLPRTEIMRSAALYIYSSPENISKYVTTADILITCAYLPLKKAPILVTENMVKTMKKGSVIIDVSIDQGGCVETSHPTTMSDPTFIKHGIVHYCVPNMPGAVPKWATDELTKATLPYLLRLVKEEQLKGGRHEK